MQRGGTKTFELTTAMEVFVYGLVLAEVSGFDRPCSKHDPLYEEALVNMQNDDSWVQVSSPARSTCTKLSSQQPCPCLAHSAREICKIRLACLHALLLRNVCEHQTEQALHTLLWSQPWKANILHRGENLYLLLCRVLVESWYHLALQRKSKSLCIDCGAAVSSVCMCVCSSLLIIATRWHFWMWWLTVSNGIQRCGPACLMCFTGSGAFCPRQHCSSCCHVSTIARPCLAALSMGPALMVHLLLFAFNHESHGYLLRSTMEMFCREPQNKTAPCLTLLQNSILHPCTRLCKAFSCLLSSARALLTLYLFHATVKHMS